MVVHPIEHDLGCAVPARGHVARHLVLGGPRQTEVENLQLAVFVHGDVGRLQILKGENRVTPECVACGRRFAY